MVIVIPGLREPRGPGGCAGLPCTAMPSPDHTILNHQEKLMSAQRVLHDALGDLRARIPPHDVTAKKALRDAREATQALPIVASSTAQGIGMGYAWRHGGIVRASRQGSDARGRRNDLLTKYFMCKWGRIPPPYWPVGSSGNCPDSP